MSYLYVMVLMIEFEKGRFMKKYTYGYKKSALRLAGAEQ